MRVTAAGSPIKCETFEDCERALSTQRQSQAALDAEAAELMAQLRALQTEVAPLSSRLSELEEKYTAALAERESRQAAAEAAHREMQRQRNFHERGCDALAAVSGVEVLSTRPDLRLQLRCAEDNGRAYELVVKSWGSDASVLAAGSQRIQVRLGCASTRSV